MALPATVRSMQQKRRGPTRGTCWTAVARLSALESEKRMRAASPQAGEAREEPLPLTQPEVTRWAGQGLARGGRKNQFGSPHPADRWWTLRARCVCHCSFRSSRILMMIIFAKAPLSPRATWPLFPARGDGCVLESSLPRRKVWRSQQRPRAPLQEQPGLL